MSTPKQNKLIKKLTENYRSKETKTLGKMLEESDYKKSTSEQPSRIIRGKGIQKALKPRIERYERELDAIQTAMELKDKNSEEYQVLVRAMETIQKLIQLLSGGATERTEVSPILGGLSIKQDDIYKNNSDRKNNET